MSRLAYADPPYPGKAHLYQENTEVDHAALVAQLAGYDGWALSTDSPNLAFVLSLCPVTVHVAAWIRTNAPPFNPDGRGAVRSWEPVIYQPSRSERLSPTRVRDVFHGGAPTGSLVASRFTGAKTASFAAWIFGLLEARPEDHLDDLFPGTGVVGSSWDAWCAQPSLFGAALGGHRSGEERPRAAFGAGLFDGSAAGAVDE
jgi:hypothetical protein